MFDDTPQKNTQPPQNLPTEPVDMFAGIEGEEPAGAGGPPSALDAGILKKKLPGAAGMPGLEGSPLAEPMLYPAKAPVLGKILTVVIILVVAAGVGYGAWWFYSSFIMKPVATTPAAEQTPAVEQPRDQLPTEQPAAEETGEFPTQQATTTEEAATTTEAITTTPPAAAGETGEAIDSDKDGLSDAREVALGTDPLNADTDNDGLTDGDEVLIWKTNPLNKDTDGDGYLDGEEVHHGYNPLGPGKLFENAPAGGATTTGTTTAGSTSSIPL